MQGFKTAKKKLLGRSWTAVAVVVLITIALKMPNGSHTIYFAPQGAAEKANQFDSTPQSRVLDGGCLCDVGGESNARHGGESGENEDPVGEHLNVIDAWGLAVRVLGGRAWDQ